MPRPTAKSGALPTFVWKARPIFLSSTFKDMHAERDYLRAHAFLSLAERLRERCHYLDVIDLRQGVENVDEADESAREMQVLKVCLDEIDRSKPFLVAMLGERYGWIPPADRIIAAARSAGMPASVDVAGRSVTELEILYGVLENPDQKRRSWFYFRTLDRTGMPPEVAARFPAEEPSADPDSPAGRLLTLKERVRREMPGRVRDYTLRWDDVKQSITGLEELDAQVERDLFGDLDAETAAYLRDAPRSWQEADARAVADFVAERTRGYVERPAVTEPMIAHALSPAAADVPWGLVVTGESGGGKSSLFGTVFDALQKRAAAGEILFLSHAAGIFRMSGQIDRMLRRWVTELAAHLGLADPLDVVAAAPPAAAESDTRRSDAPVITSEQIEKIFAELLEQVAASFRVVVLIDALNQFEPTVRASHLTWLPKEWPPNARLVATAIPGTASVALAARPGCRELPVPRVTREEAHAIAERFYRERHHRAVNPRVVDALLSKTVGSRPAHGNPLWLALALQEMNLLEADDFERAEREFAALAGAARMEALQLAEAVRLPGDVPGIYGELLARAERGFGVAWTRAFTNLVAVSRAGWRESDLRSNLMKQVSGEEWDDLAFAGVRRTLGTHVVQRGAHAQWDFFHTVLRDTVLRRDLADEADRRRLHGFLADHLEGLQPADPLRISETMVHLIGLGDRDRAAGYLAGLQSRQWSDADAKDGLAGAVSVLVEAIQAAADDPARDRLTAWIAGLLSGDSDEGIGRVANAFIFDLNDALKLTGAAQTEMPRQRLLEESQLSLGDLRASNPQSADYARSLSVSYIKLGDLQHGLGSGNSAMDFYEKALGIAEELHGRDPLSAVFARDLSVIYNMLGYIHRGFGDRDKTLEFYEKDLQIAEELHRRYPLSAGYARDLTVSYERLGDHHSRLGNVAKALKFIEMSLEIAEELNRKDPYCVDYARDLSRSCNKLGDLYLGFGKGAKALEFFEKALEIREELLRRNPQSADNCRDISVSCGRLGDLLCGFGNGAKALEFYEKALGITEELRRRNPQDAGYARDLSMDYTRLGDLDRRFGDGTKALELYQIAMGVAEELYQRDPQCADYARDLSRSYSKLGDVHQGLRNVAKAMEFYELALGIAEELNRRNPVSADYARELSVHNDRLGDLQRGLGDEARAFEFYEKALRIREELRAKNLQSGVYARDLSVSYNKLGDLHLGFGNGARALEFYENALGIAEELRARSPQSAVFARDLWALYSRIAVVYEKLKRGDTINWWRKAYEQIVDMKQRGILLPTDEKFLETLRQKAGG